MTGRAFWFPLLIVAAIAGLLLDEEMDIFEDYKRFFGEEPPQLGAVALMSDTDNTGDEAVAYFGDISLRTRSR